MKYRVCHVTPGVWKVQWRRAWLLRGFAKNRAAELGPDMTFASHQDAHDYISVLRAQEPAPRWKPRHGKWQ